MAQHPQQVHPVMAVQGMTTIHPLEAEEVMGLQPPVQALMGEVVIVMGVVEGATEVLTVMEALMGVAAAEVAMEVHLVAAATHMDHLEAEAMVAAATAVDHLVAAVAMATAAAVEAMEAAAVVAEAMVTAAAAVAMEAAVEVAAAEASVAAAAAVAVVEEAAMVKTKSSLTTKSMPLASQPTSQKKILPHFLAQLE